MFAHSNQRKTLGMNTAELTNFIYLYRDAGNFKVEGQLCLIGRLSTNQKDSFRSLLIDHEWFVPEQVGLQPLHSELFAYSNGPTTADHALHEFVDFVPCELAVPAESINLKPINQLIKRFQMASKRWNLFLSPCA